MALLAFIAPDLSSSGYFFGARVGTLVFNSVDVYALGAAVIALGLLYALPLVTGLGVLWLAHSGFDRLLGYGLKSSEAFSVTHLGRIGKAR